MPVSQSRANPSVIQLRNIYYPGIYAGDQEPSCFSAASFSTPALINKLPSFGGVGGDFLSYQIIKFYPRFLPHNPLSKQIIIFARVLKKTKNNQLTTC
jgi:hypothetical protein